MIPAIDVDHFSGNSTSQRADQEQCRVADFALFRCAAERCELPVVIHHLADAGDAAGGEGFDRTGGDGIHPDVLGAEVVGKITDGGFECGFGDPHDIVVGHDPFRSEVGERDDRAAVGHQGQGGSGDGNERIGAHVKRRGEILAAWYSRTGQ